MEFWGVEVKAGESVKVVPEEGSIIHISQAALGEQKGKGKGLIPLRVKIEDKKFILGSLSAESIPHVTFDLVFHTEFELSHDSKDCSVYFLGYKGDVEDEEYPSDSDNSEDESMDAEDDLLQIDEETLKKLMPSTNGAKSDKKAKVAVKDPVKKVDVDSSDEEDEDDSSDDDIPAIGEEDDSDDESEEDDDDDSSEEETPKEIKGGKKRVAEANPSVAKKAKVGAQPSKPAFVKAPAAVKAPAFNKSKGQGQKNQANKAKKGGK